MLRTEQFQSWIPKFQQQDALRFKNEEFCNEKICHSETNSEQYIILEDGGNCQKYNRNKYETSK